MNKKNVEKLYCKQDVANEWLDQDPSLFSHIAEDLHTKLGKALADKISDGQLYVVSMDKPHIDSLGALNPNCTAIKAGIRVGLLTFCKDCKWCIDGGKKRAMICTNPYIDVDIHPYFLCGYGEREGE